MRRRRSICRIVTRASAFLLLGAIVNVAVAWTCAVTSHFTAETRGVFTASDRDLIECEGEEFDSSRILVERFGRGIAQRSVALEDSLERTINMKKWNEALNTGAGMIEPKIESAFVHRVEAGWPLRATGAEVWEHSFTWMDAHGIALDESPYRVAYGFIVGPPLPSSPKWNLRFDAHRVLPLRPIWPGFAINTLFYAAILWGFFAAPFALRRRRRIKRGLCPKCAYDLRGCASQNCPECGAEMIKQKAETQKAEMS